MTGGSVSTPPQGCTPLSGLGPTVWLVFALFGMTAGCGSEPTPPPARLALVTQPSTLAQSRVALVAQPVVELQDDQGATVHQAGVPVTASIAPGGGSLTGTTTVNTASTGRATFTDLAVAGLVGPRTLTFTSPNLAPVTSGTIDLSPGVPATIAVNGGDAQSAGTGSAVEVAPSS